MAKILHGDTNGGPRRIWLMSTLKPEVEFCRKVGRILFRVHISVGDQDIFTKFGAYVDNGVPQRADG